MGCVAALYWAQSFDVSQSPESDYLAIEVSAKSFKITCLQRRLIPSDPSPPLRQSKFLRSRHSSYVAPLESDYFALVPPSPPRCCTLHNASNQPLVLSRCEDQHGRRLGRGFCYR
jgi:hypothetical protein